jgi:hypothetical protein
MLLYFIIGILLIFMGLSVHVFKWYFLISGYNTMPKEKQEKVDTKGLGLAMGIYFYANGAVWIIFGILHAFGSKPNILIPIVFFGISTAYFLIKAQKFDGNIYDKKGSLRIGKWKQLLGPYGTSILAFILVAVMFIVFSQPTKVTVLDTGFQIHGMYGGTYSWESIKEINLTDNLPVIQRRTSGAAIGPNLRGHFSTDIGPVKLFVNQQLPPFIFLRIDDKIIILNLKTPEDTNNLYRSILERIK